MTQPTYPAFWSLMRRGFMRDDRVCVLTAEGQAALWPHDNYRVGFDRAADEVFG